MALIEGCKHEFEITVPLEGFPLTALGFAEVVLRLGDALLWGRFAFRAFALVHLATLPRIT